MRRFYRLYMITSPDGRRYVGMTNQPIETRWRAHVSEAFGAHGHAMAADGIAGALRAHGPDGFEIEELASALDKESAMQSERDLILQHRTMFPSGLNRRMARDRRPPIERDWIIVGARAQRSVSEHAERAGAA